MNNFRLRSNHSYRRAKHSQQVAVRRAGGRCEGCRQYYGNDLEAFPAFEPRQVPEPWVRELVVMLCPRCGEAMTSGLRPALNQEVQRFAAWALAVRTEVSCPLPSEQAESSLQVARAVIETLEARHRSSPKVRDPVAEGLF